MQEAALQQEYMKTLCNKDDVIIHSWLQLHTQVEFINCCVCPVLNTECRAVGMMQAVQQESSNILHPNYLYIVKLQLLLLWSNGLPPLASLIAKQTLFCHALFQLMPFYSSFQSRSKMWACLTRLLPPVWVGSEHETTPHSHLLPPPPLTHLPTSSLNFKAHLPSSSLRLYLAIKRLSYFALPPNSGILPREESTPAITNKKEKLIPHIRWCLDSGDIP